MLAGSMTGDERRGRAGIRVASGKPGGWIGACGLACCVLMLVMPGPASAVCRFEPLAASVTGIGADGVLHLDDGTDAQIADIAIVRPDDALDMIRAEQAAIRRLVDGAPDRWGRLPVTLAGPGQRQYLTHARTSRLRPHRSRGPTGPVRSRPDGDRERGTPVPARPMAGSRQPPRSMPATTEPCSTVSGNSSLVEGRVESVGVRARTTFIDFTKRWRGGFTVTVPNALWQEITVQTLAPEGLDADDLTGRRIRVRGVLQRWRGPAVELAIAAFIEILEDDS